jgi:dolichol-phosphate mannosyltransferase
VSARRVLITGAAGFVGANLAARLMRDGHDVHALVRPGSDRWRLALAGLELTVHDADLADADSIVRVVAAARPEWVFHLGAYGAYSWQTDRPRMATTNVLGTMHLLDTCCARGFDAFVHAGSSSEYGFKDRPASEDERAAPNSPYAVTKLAATEYCAYVGRTANLHVVTLRLYSVFGPMEEPGRLVPSLVLHGLQGEYPPLTHPASSHDFVYVDDVIDAFVLAAAAGSSAGSGEIFNVASGRSVSLAEIVEVIRTILAVPAQPAWGTHPGRPWDTAVWAGDNARIRDRLGWRPRYSLEQGLRAAIEWFRQHVEIRGRYLAANRAAGR